MHVPTSDCGKQSCRYSGAAREGKDPGRGGGNAEQAAQRRRPPGPGVGEVGGAMGPQHGHPVGGPERRRAGRATLPRARWGAFTGQRLGRPCGQPKGAPGPPRLPPGSVAGLRAARAPGPSGLAARRGLGAPGLRLLGLEAVGGRLARVGLCGPVCSGLCGFKVGKTPGSGVIAIEKRGLWCKRLPRARH